MKSLWFRLKSLDLAKAACALLAIFLTLAQPAAAAKLACEGLFERRSSLFEELFGRVSPRTKGSRLQLVSEEAWPVEVHERLDKNGIYNRNTGTYRFFTKQVFHSGDLQIEILDSTIGRGRPPQFFDELRKIDHRNFEFYKSPPSAHFPDVEAELNAGGDPAYFYNRWGPALPVEWSRKAEDNLINEGVKVQRQAIQEVLDMVFPLYRERRHWDDSIESLRVKAFDSKDDTRYIVIRKKGTLPSDPLNPIIATLGVTRNTYGRVKFFNKKTQSWEERTGKFGATFDSSQYTPDMLIDLPLPDRWMQAPERLPMEKVFGDVAFLPRPATPETYTEGESDVNSRFRAILNATGFGKQKTEFGRKQLRMWPPGIEVDFTKPIEFSSGQIFEPVKFAILKGQNLSRAARKELLSQLFLAVFPENKNLKKSLASQNLYTYNDLEGTNMYKQLGFKELTSVKSKTVEGREWFALELSPQNLIDLLADKKTKLTEEQAADIAERLQDSMMYSNP